MKSENRFEIGVMVASGDGGRLFTPITYTEPIWVDLGLRGVTVLTNPASEGDTSAPRWPQVVFWNWRVVDWWRADADLMPRVLDDRPGMEINDLVATALRGETEERRE